LLTVVRRYQVVVESRVVAAVKALGPRVVGNSGTVGPSSFAAMLGGGMRGERVACA